MLPPPRRFTGLISPSGQPARREKVVVGYPVGGSVTLGFHGSVLRLLGYELAKPDEERLLSRITHTSGLYVADNRQLLVERFLGMEEADWLLQIDTDIAFPADLLERMIAMTGDEARIVAASVPLGAYPSCAFNMTETPGIWLAVHPVPGEPIEVDGIATACVLIHREVFETIAARHGQCWFHHIYLPASSPETPRAGFRYRSQGEDLAFSVRAREAGFSIWCATVPGLSHYKTDPLSHDFGLSGSARAAQIEVDDTPVGAMVQEG